MRTSSKREICATIRANVGGTGRNCPGQDVRLCGHESQMATCGSHSAGMRNPRLPGVAAAIADFGSRDAEVERLADRGVRMADWGTADRRGDVLDFDIS